MHKYERQTILMKFLEQQDFIGTKKLIAQLQEKYDFTEITIRRDLKEIAQTGKISLLHGGIKLLKLTNQPETLKIIDNKLLFAKKANELIQNNEVIFLNSGLINTTLISIIKKTVSIVTNSLSIFNLSIANKNILNTLLIGGHYLKKQNVLIGNYSLKSITDLQISRCIINASSISNDYNLYAQTEGEAQIKKQILKNSNIKIFISEKENLNTVGFSEYANLSECDIFITDELKIKNDKSINSVTIDE